MQPLFVKKEDNLVDVNRFEIKEFKSQSVNYNVVWSENNQIYLSTHGRICIIDSLTLEEIYG